MNQTNILFADDDISMRQLLRELLTSLGYKCDEAADGAQAIEKLKSDTFDVAILDVTMPGKSGLDVLQFIRENNLRCKAIMLTGRVGFEVGAKSMKLGADDYITKPFDLEYLQFSINRVLAK
jgi:DNA-binding response OmpR family regulator